MFLWSISMLWPAWPLSTGRRNMYKYKMAYISGIVHFSLLSERLFSSSQPRGTQGARVPTRLQFDLRRRSVPQALVAQSRAALTLCPGMGAAPSRPTRVLETRIYVFFNVRLKVFSCDCDSHLLLCHSHTSPPSSSSLVAVTVQQLVPRIPPPPSGSLLVALTVQQQPWFKPVPT